MSEILTKSEVQTIASAQYNFKIELILNIGTEDISDLIETSKGLVEVFGEHSLLNQNNIYKYFNKKTLPFIARHKGTIIGYIIGVPLEHFHQEAWSHFDINLDKKNTLYTYAFVIRKQFQGKNGYAKTLKKIYLSWAKKRNYKYISGHVAHGICQKFKKTELVKTFPVWYDAKTPFDYYRRKI